MSPAETTGLQPLEKENYGFFYPSAGLSFVFSDAFSINNNILSFGKVRASWAQVGNDSDPYLTKRGYTSYTTSFLGSGFASKSGTIPLFNLKNELSESWEIGTDLRFFQNRIGLDVTYYNGFTTNQILPVDISSQRIQTVSLMPVRSATKGSKPSLNVTPVSLSNSFRWDVTFNYAKNNSVVEELGSWNRNLPAGRPLSQ